MRQIDEADGNGCGRDARGPRRVYDERPVSVRRFVTDEEYLGIGDDVYPKVVETLSRIFRGKYEEAVLCWGIGSGKSYLCSIALTYMLYRTLCLRNPQRYFHLAEDSEIHIVNVGPTARLAEKVVYGQVRRMVHKSPWFSEKYPADSRIRRELHFPKNITVLPGNSSETFPLGLNVLCATMDEAAFFVETLDGEREAAEDIYVALQRRIKSRFGNKGLMMIASSPRHGEDFIMRKLAEAEGNPTIFASRKAAWEVKPRDKFCGKKFEHSGLMVPVEYERDFKRDPQKALRDIAAVPGMAFQPFFLDMAGLEEACEERREDGKTGRWEDGGPGGRGDGGPANSRPLHDPHLRHPFEGDGRLAEWFKPDDREGRYIHVDLGLKKDACGIAMAKVIGEGGRPVVVVELMQRIKAPPGGEVDLALVRELILALRKRGFPIAQVSYDGWQSADSQQILRRQGLQVATVSVDRDLGAYETLKEVANDRRLRMYEFKPFLDECRRLELVKGIKVEHPPTSSKDVADAVAGAVSEAVKGWRGGEGVRGRIV